MFETLYSFVVHVGRPYLYLLPHRRARKGKEIKTRIHERYGQSSEVRPDGRMIWIHAASNGETLSALPLIEYLTTLPSAPKILLTTMTVTAARLVENRTDAETVFHQFIPYDHPKWIARFHKKWLPDMVIWVESELWPHHLQHIKKSNIPAILLNARLSDRSVNRWKRVKRSFQSLMTVFNIILAQTERDKDNLLSLGIDNVHVKGNLKDLAHPLPFDEYALQDMQNCIGQRPVIVFASTHDPEEKVAANVHKRLKQDYPDLLTILIPRHPKRGEEIAEDLNNDGLSVALRSAKMSPRVKTDIYIADTLGELGLFFTFAPIVFIGNSMAGVKPGGGHNLLEPAWFDCAIISGDDLHNFSVLAKEMPESNACKIINNENELYNALKAFLENEESRKNLANNAYEYVAKKQNNGMQDIIAAIEPTCKTAGLL